MVQKEIIAALDQAVAALKAARKALVSNQKQAATKSSTLPQKVSGKEAPAKKGMSEQGRQRIAEAQRKRWAISKRAAKKAARLAAK